MYVIIEGMPGTGKTSTAKALAKRLTAQYMKSAFPATELGWLMQSVHDSGKIKESELLYLASAHADELKIHRLLAQGLSVVKDKSLFTSIAHLKVNGYANKNESVVECVDGMYMQLIELSCEPDLVVFLSTDLKTVQERAKYKTDVSQLDERLFSNPEVYLNQERMIKQLLEEKYRKKILYINAFSSDCETIVDKIIETLTDKKE